MKNIRHVIPVLISALLLVQSCVTDEDGYSEYVLSIIDTLGVSVVDEPEEVIPICSPDENTSEFNVYNYEWDYFDCAYDYFDDEYTLKVTSYWTATSFNVKLTDYPENGIYYTSGDAYPGQDEIYIYLLTGSFDSYPCVEGDSVFVQKFTDGTVAITFCDILLDIGVSYMELNGNVTYDGDNCD